MQEIGNAPIKKKLNNAEIHYKLFFNWAISSFFLRRWLFNNSILRFNIAISTYCWLMVSRIYRISSAMFCSTLEMSVTCSFMGMKVRKISEIRKRIRLFFRWFSRKIILTDKAEPDYYYYRWIVTIVHNSVNKRLTTACLSTSKINNIKVGSYPHNYDEVIHQFPQSFGHEIYQLIHYIQYYTILWKR